MNLEHTVVRAPFSGIVTDKAAQVGDIGSPLSAGGGFTRTGIGGERWRRWRSGFRSTT